MVPFLLTPFSAFLYFGLLTLGWTAALKERSLLKRFLTLKLHQSSHRQRLSEVGIVPCSHMESERQTRKKRIDPLLRGLGWKIVPIDEARPLSELSNCAIEEYPTENGPADYALCVNGEIIGVVRQRN